jgi:hypothetical protein
MCQPLSRTRWLLAGALVCALAGVMLKATDPVLHQEPPAHRANEWPRRAVKRAAPRVVSSREPRHRSDALRAPSLAAAPDNGLWLSDEPARVAVARDGAWSFGEPPQAAFAQPLLLAGGARVPAPDQAVVRDPTVTRPALPPRVGQPSRKKHRRMVRQRHADDQREGGDSPGERVPGDTPTVDRLPRDTPTVPPPAAPPVSNTSAPPTPPATAANTDAAASDAVAFQSGDDVQFPTVGQVSIPIQAEDQHEGGSVSLWVQPAWERGNEDDATLVQLGDRLRLAKDVHSLRLETADAGAEDSDGPASVAVPITEWNPGEWHHVAATWRGNVVSLYVDGDLVGRRMGRGRVDLPPDTELLVGSDLGESRPVAPGLIGRVDVRSRPLGDDEVASDYRDVVSQDGRSGRGMGPDDHGGGSDDRSRGPDDRGHGFDPRGGADRGRFHQSDRGAAR